ncbi:VWA domain-containing protein, partial [Candidatus Bathyarchaeota archaeon]|nr:VWA domain-containing protein [Candidatus Bathyarchaeota archaeon]
ERKISVTGENIHLKIRDGKSSYLVIFCVDASGSMGVERRMEMVKGAVFSILQDNYINRDKVAMITFRNEGATLLLPPTRSTEMAHKVLKEIPTGGTTPLAAGLVKVLDLVREERRKKSGYLPLVILLTDARGNVWLKDGIEDIEKIGYQFAKESIPAIIIDTESSDVNLGLSKKLAKAAGARYHHIDHLENDTLEHLLVQEGIMHIPGDYR